MAAEPPSEFSFACMNGDIVSFNEYLRKHPDTDLNAVLEKGRDYTPLMLACENPQAGELVRQLVEVHRVEIGTCKTHRKVAPLHVALAAKSEVAARILIDAGADLAAKDLVERTAMHYACVTGLLRIVMSIAARGGRSVINAKEANGYTPLMLACEYNHADVANFLVDAGADKDATNRLSHNAAELSDWYGHVEILRVVEADAAPPAADAPAAAGGAADAPASAPGQ